MTSRTFFKITLVAIIATSLFVLNKTRKADKHQIIAITQIVPHPSLDKIRAGVEDTLKKKLGDNVEIIYQNANGNIATATQIAHYFSSLKPNAIVSITTPSTQTMVSTKLEDTPVVFAGVSNPSQAKLSQTIYPFLTGVSDAPPLMQQAKLVQIIFNLQNKKNGVVGILYSASEDNATYQAHALVKELKNLGIACKLYTVGASRDISTSAALAADQCDLIYVGNDNLIVSGIESVIRTCTKQRKPLMVSDPESIEKGATIAYAFDQYFIGVQAGELVLDALKKNIKPFENAVHTELYMNDSALENLGLDSKQIKQTFLNPEIK